MVAQISAAVFDILAKQNLRYWATFYRIRTTCVIPKDALIII